MAADPIRAADVRAWVLKAFLAWQDRPFRKTHNLTELGVQCAELDDSLEPLLRRAAPLTDFAWKFRYPGEPEAPSGEEAHATLELAVTW